MATGLASWFRIVYLFNVWALSIVLGFVACLLVASSAGTVEAVPSVAWVVVIANGVLFALYFLLSGPVAAWLERTGRMPTVLDRIGKRLAAWDEAGRE